MDTKLASFILRRLINAVITLFILIVILFILIHAIVKTPQGLAEIIAGNPHAPPSEIQEIIRQYGLNQPLYIQIFTYIWNLLHGNWGTDVVYKVPELDLIGKFLPITLELVIPAVILSTIIGIISGAIAAANRKKWSDYLIKGVYLTTWASPPFFVAVILLIVVSYDLGLLPSGGIVNPLLKAPPSYTPFPLLNSLIAGDWPYFTSMIRHMILPMFALSLVSFGIVTRLTRATMLDVMESEFVKLGFMKGLKRRKVVYGMALRNASIPIITLVALFFGYSVAGAVVIEDVFDYKGMGWFIAQSIISLDYIAVLDTTIIVGFSIIIANLIADILYAVIDPRVKLE
ncbi:peptide ABC transporter permease [Candidatus Acidianus copahuensis]|uniref:Peptide ABC transporter permease n=1 Tax=Candidatus Acidianus copahuensis TaxID=1160895 RepID=A0A031LN25_9CREN|nr:peptide ABC transporter permease [Candidatus Acidianus copahuensis]